MAEVGFSDLFSINAKLKRNNGVGNAENGYMRYL